MKPAYTSSNQGFTLIELSIVLVIIGLIIGSILVGRDLIKSAQIRSAISQISKYNQATNAFRLKFNGLPGDLINAPAFGLPGAQGSGLTIYSPRNNTLGDGLIMSCQDDSLTVAVYSYVAFGCENSIFFVHLSAANLIDGSFVQTALANAFLAGVTPASQADLYLPKSPLNSNYLRIYAWNSVNYFHLQGIAGYAVSDSNGSTSARNNISPLEAIQIDRKLDDGSPITGTVKAFDNIDTINTRLILDVGSPTSCRNASNQYNTGTTFENNYLCQLQFKVEF